MASSLEGPFPFLNKNLTISGIGLGRKCHSVLRKSTMTNNTPPPGDHAAKL